MDRRLIRLAGAAALLLLPAACATGGASAPPPLPVSGYLDPASLETLAEGFTPSPQALTWIETPATDDRWWMATAQAELRPPEAAQHFDCALGTRLSARPRPALTRLMNRLMLDGDALTRRLATDHPRARPIAVNPALQPCQRVTEAMRDGPSWPAGGAVIGAAYGEMFAALAPDRATQARGMGRTMGLSRVVCRMNWPGDATDGERIGQALYAHAAAEPGFTADLDAARAELAAARAENLTSPACASERRALGSN